MSIFKFNKKLYTIILMLVLMIIIILISNLFNNKIKSVALSNNNVDKFIDYKIGRDRVYSISLPENWIITKTSLNDNKFYLEISGSKDVVGKVEIVDGNLENYILNQEKHYSIEKEDGWNIFSIINHNDIEKYYIKNYSEGKILILKFSYNRNKEKDSIDIVFDNIASSFN